MHYIPAIHEALMIKSLDSLDVNQFYLDSTLVAQSLLDSDDKGLLSLSEYANYLRYMRLLTNTTILADAQSGFGNAMNTYYAVQELERSGANAILINDQTYPAHNEARKVSADLDFAGKVKAALDATENPKTEIIAELDGFHLYGLEGVVHRLRLCQTLGIKSIVLQPLSSKDLEEVRKTLKPDVKLGTITQHLQDLPKSQVDYVIDTGTASRAWQQFAKTTNQALQQNAQKLAGGVLHEI